MQGKMEPSQCTIKVQVFKYAHMHKLKTLMYLIFTETHHPDK